MVRQPVFLRKQAAHVHWITNREGSWFSVSVSVELLLLLVDESCQIRSDQIKTGTRSTSKVEFGWGSTGGGVRRDPVVEEELG